MGEDWSLGSLESRGRNSHASPRAPCLTPESRARRGSSEVVGALVLNLSRDEGQSTDPGSNVEE